MSAAGDVGSWCPIYWLPVVCLSANVANLLRGFCGPRRERNSAPREGLICVMQLTRPSSNLTNWPAMSDRIHPVLFFILRGLNR
jgi:hypothetical protein